MYLKRIVLHGFKSFADRTEFDFGQGLTMIVGPNGCGKSNVLDALRWVLGEQSAKSLRGHKMMDVIFSGSRSRKPANAASVELVFDNRTGFLATDDREVTVGRTLYRSGESDYRINGKSCRLKDVRHLFLDTGVGVDAYSIIEQGRVDVLLQSNPIERREIFEEAAGISRYKVQRTEAQRKLERTQNNLLRLNDVIDELERRLRSVKAAAAKARRWQEHDQRLRERRATFSLAEYHQLECSRKETQERINELNEGLQALRSELAGHDAQAAEHERQLQSLDEQIQAADGRLTSLQTELSALAERIDQGAQRMEDLAATRARRLQQADELSRRIDEMHERVERERQSHASLAAEAEQSASRIEALGTQHAGAARQRDESRAALEWAKTDAFEAVRRSTLLHSEQNNLGNQRQRYLAQQERLRQKQTELTGDQERLGAARDEANRAVAALDESAAELGGKLRQIDEESTTLDGQRSELEQRLGEARQRRSALQSRLEVLEDLESRSDGVDKGTQAILSWREGDERPGSIVGLVADLLRIDDPRVWILQPVLSTFENNVVVRDSCMFLAELPRRDELPGPVRLLALDRLPADRPEEYDYRESPGFVARAADWVRCEPTLQPLADHLLGRVVIVDVIERALALAAGAPAGYVFVTLDGRTVDAQGRMTIGAAKATPGLISRKAEIRQSQTELDEIESQLVQDSRRRNELDEQASDLRVRRNETVNQIARVQREHAEARHAQARLESEGTRIEREAAGVTSELNAVERGLAELETQVQRLLAEAADIDQTQREHEVRIETVKQELRAHEETTARIARELTEARVEAGRVAEKCAAGAEALAALLANVDAQRREQESAAREADEAQRQIAELEDAISQARQRQEACREELRTGEDAVRKLREQRQVLRQQLESCGAKTREVQARLHGVEEDLHQCEVARREVDVRQENLVARLREELDLDLVEQYASYEHTEQDWDEIRAEIEELRQKIARLGNVNLDALTELEELTPRYENLVTQRADLVDAVERLETLIADLDRESRERFLTAFDEIRKNFQDLFRKLFGGGKADIILEDPEQPLECGIEIIARPPGKEPQSISLLSGGERTMTAVGLVMAVFRSKPSPFAFLDEVDAALDEANTERFNTLLQDFMSQSQFVVITHSKRTMAAADVLYGVTMEEPGVSKRVSVRFEDRVQTPEVA